MASIFDKIIAGSKITANVARQALAAWDESTAAGRSAFMRNIADSFARGIPADIQMEIFRTLDNPWRVLKDPCPEVQRAATTARNLEQHGAKLATLITKATHVDSRVVGRILPMVANEKRFLTALAKREDLQDDTSLQRLLKRHGFAATEKQERAPRGRRPAQVAPDVEQFLADLRDADLTDKSVLTSLRKEARTYAIDLPAAVRNALGVTLAQARKLVKALVDAATVSHVRAAIEALTPSADEVDYVANFENASTPAQIRKAAQELLSNAKAAGIDRNYRARPLLQAVVKADSARAVKAAQKAALEEIVGVDDEEPEEKPTRGRRRTQTGATETKTRRRSGATAKTVDLYGAFESATSVREMRNAAQALLDNEKLSAAAKRMLNGVVHSDGAAAVRHAYAAAVKNVCGTAETVNKLAQKSSRTRVEDPTVELTKLAQHIIDLSDSDKDDLIAARKAVREMLPTAKDLLSKLNLSRLAKGFLTAADDVAEATSVSQVRNALSVLKEEAETLVDDQSTTNDLDVKLDADDLDDIDDLDSVDGSSATEVDSILEQIISSDDLKEVRNLARDILEDVDLSDSLEANIVEALEAIASAKTTSAVRSSREELISMWQSDDSLVEDEIDEANSDEDDDLVSQFLSKPLKTSYDLETALSMIEADVDAFRAAIQDVLVADGSAKKALSLVTKAIRASRISDASAPLTELHNMLAEVGESSVDEDQQSETELLEDIRAYASPENEADRTSTELRNQARELLARIEAVEFGDDYDSSSIADIRDSLSAIAEASKSAQVSDGLELLNIALELLDDETDEVSDLHDEEDEDLDDVTVVAGAKQPLRKARTLSQVLAEDNEDSLDDAEDDLLKTADVDDLDDDQLSRVVRRVRGRRV